MEEVMRLEIKEADGRRFYFRDFGSEVHDRTSFRLWVSPRLVEWEENEEEGKVPIIKFPVKNASIRQGKSKYTMILRPENGGIVYHAYIKSGYRGTGKITKFNPEPFEVAVYRIYASPRGSLGISSGYLIMLDKEAPLTYHWEKSGRLYGKPGEGTTIMYPDGNVEEFPETDLCEIEDLGEELGS